MHDVHDPITKLLRCDNFLNIHQVMSPSCLSVLSQHVASQSKWRSVDRPLKTSKEVEKCVVSAIPR